MLFLTASIEESQQEDIIVNQRDILLSSKFDSFEESMESICDLLELNDDVVTILDTIIFKDSFETISISDEERKDILKFIDELDLSLEEDSIREEYSEEEECGLKYPIDRNFFKC